MILSRSIRLDVSFRKMVFVVKGKIGEEKKGIRLEIKGNNLVCFVR